MTRIRATAPFLSGLPVIAILVIACSSGGAASPSGSSPTSSGGAASSSPDASASVALPITDPDHAAQLVIARDPRFARVRKHDKNAIGGCCFYEATARGDGTFEVKIDIGWGDCPAGCIDHHEWVFAVTADGNVTLERETGKPIPSGVTGDAGGGANGFGILPDGPGIAGLALAGPTCPVVQPNDPNCKDRPVAAATVLIRDATGTVVAQMTTDAQGRFHVSLPPGPYRVEPQPVEGLMNAPASVEVTVGASFVIVTLPYDTGIR
jgi:hypothetical protein